ncbi:hypothetical protein ABPG72_013227 [Tetrahymena utriculariae]
MGNFLGVRLSRNQKYINENIDLINFLKKKKMKDIYETVEIIRDYYPTNQSFSQDEFCDAFQLLLDEYCERFFLILENQHNPDGAVDLYESLATCVILCGDEFDLKIEFVFQLFDFNKNETIEQDELVLNNQASIRGLCKIASLPAPTLKQIEDYTMSIFKDVDSDKGGTVSLDEYKSWIKFNWELQDFFLKYANVQTFENAERRCTEFKFTFEKLFNTIVGNTAEFVDANILDSILSQELKQTQDGNMNILMNVLKATSKVDCPNIKEGQIYKKSYLAVMKSWGAFDSTDINGDNKLSIDEIKFLIYAYEGDKPDEDRLQYEMEQLDKDNSGYVTRKEWIEYLCIDPNNAQKAAFRTDLKTLFLQYDQDRSGYLTKQELLQLLQQQMSSYTAIYQAKGGKDLQDYKGMVNSITETIMEQMEGKYQTGRVSWSQFKIFMEKAYVEMENLKEFLNTLLS